MTKAFDARELSTSELAGLLPSKPHNPLAIRMNGDGGKAPSKKLSLNPDEELLVNALSQPVQRVDLQYTIGERHYLEASLAWSGESETIAFLARRDKKWGLSQRQPNEIITSLSQVIGLNAPMKLLLVGGRFSSMAGLACLSLADAYRREYYQSALEFRPPSSSFTLEEIAAWFSPPKGWDPRWISLFLAKILPDEGEPIEDEVLETALGELVQAGFLQSLEADGKDPQLFTLSAGGERFCEGMLTQASKVAIRHGRLLEGDQVGYEILMMIRDADALWFLDVGSQEAMLTTLDHQAALGILEQIFMAPESHSEGAQTLSMADEEASTIMLGERDRVIAFCPECGSPVDGQNRFCTNCGAKLTKNSGGE